ncbi:hypothetical protein CDL15_Pgr001050 [Punica granatum]|uniref:Uncharacterized protein n=1 Tax=Punica granatum TaxID=22663 RepID=A0A218X0S9_PUNGR|nr:hypothetical protein CDL15_Pgr001050 [Punica granatum]
MRNHLNVMARLAKVVEGNGTSRKLDAPDGGSRDPIVFTAGMWCWGLQMENLSSRMDSEVGSGGARNTGWFSVDFGRFRPWDGLDEMRKRAGV